MTSPDSTPDSTPSGPDAERAEGELSDDQLEAAAGGGLGEALLRMAVDAVVDMLPDGSPQA